MGAPPGRTAEAVIVGGAVTGCYLFKLSPAVGCMMADLRAFRLDRFAATPHDGDGAFSHSYLR